MTDCVHFYAAIIVQQVRNDYDAIIVQQVRNYYAAIIVQQVSIDCAALENYIGGN